MHARPIGKLHSFRMRIIEHQDNCQEYLHILATSVEFNARHLPGGNYLNKHSSLVDERRVIRSLFEGVVMPPPASKGLLD